MSPMHEQILESKGPRSFIVSVSGGPDSMALALLASEWAIANGYTMHTITIDHALRDEAASEAAQVSSWLAARNIASEVRRIDWNENNGAANPNGCAIRSKPGPVSYENSRKRRYHVATEFARQLGVRYLLTAHQRDDNIENFLLRLSHYSGVYGLASIRSLEKERVGDWHPILFRPLLEVEKGRLIATCNHYGQPFVVDPHNSRVDDPNLGSQRARIRHALSLLTRDPNSTCPSLSDGLSSLINTFSLVRHYSELSLASFYATEVSRDFYIGCYIIKLSTFCLLPSKFSLRFLAYMIAKCNGNGDDSSTYYTIKLDDIAETIRSGKTATARDCRFMASSSLDKLFIFKIVPRGKRVLISPSGSLLTSFVLGGWRIRLNSDSKLTEYLSQLKSCTLYARSYAKTDHQKLWSLVPPNQFKLAIQSAVPAPVLFENLLVIAATKEERELSKVGNAIHEDFIIAVPWFASTFVDKEFKRDVGWRGIHSFFLPEFLGEE